jgi:hypothetical protein
MSIDGYVADFPRNSGMAAPEAIPQGYGASDSGADCHEQHTIRRVVSPFVELGHSRAVHVVVDNTGHAQSLSDQLGQRDVEPAIQHYAATYSAYPKIHLTRKADAGHIERSEGVAQLPRRPSDEVAGFHRSRIPPGRSYRASQDPSTFICQAGE